MFICINIAQMLHTIPNKKFHVSHFEIDIGLTLCRVVYFISPMECMLHTVKLVMNICRYDDVKLVRYYGQF